MTESGNLSCLVSSGLWSGGNCLRILNCSCGGHCAAHSVIVLVSTFSEFFDEYLLYPFLY